MAKVTLLSELGKDAKGLFKWLGSSSGQSTIAVVETAAEVAAPAATGIINLINKWIKGIVTTEVVSVAAGEQAGSGTEKAAAVITQLTPDVIAFAEANGYNVPDAQGIEAINTALATILNMFTPNSRRFVVLTNALPEATATVHHE